MLISLIFVDFSKLVMDQPLDRWMDKAFYRDMRMHLKMLILLIFVDFSKLVADQSTDGWMDRQSLL